jgi:cytochrome oxidase Cu insertion factor (SCO1/SenC/PrrC family)
MEAGARTHATPHRRRPGARRIAAVAAWAALAGVAIGFGVGLHYLLAKPASAPAAAATAVKLDGEATWAPGAQAAPPITTLRDQTGRLFSLNSLRGRTIAMVFFDSYCTQACPLQGRALAVAEAALPAAQRPVLVAVSVNPRDTPASTRDAVRRWGLAQTGSWHWLRGSHAQLALVWKAYRIFVAPPAHGDISHTEALYLIDRGGYERSAYLYPFVPHFVTSDLRTLASGREG